MSLSFECIQATVLLKVQWVGQGVKFLRRKWTDMKTGKDPMLATCYITSKHEMLYSTMFLHKDWITKQQD